ncbi:MAG: hypothetical protein EXS01_01255 [Phycisphaerales bacterium]|nr:hypothetical protein [Phycisphaerales bacterium]
MRTPLFRVHLILCLVLMPVLPTTQLHAEDAAVVAALNSPLKDVSEKNRSAKQVFDAYIKLSTPPMAVGDDFNQATVWPTMARWNEVSKWAEANSHMGEALIGAQFATAFGLPYGVKDSNPAWVKAGLTISIGDGATVGLVRYDYFPAVRTIGAYAAAEMYRLGEAGQFDAAFSVGIGYARFLRQICEQGMLREKLFGLQNLAESLSIHRDFMWQYLDRLPVEAMQKVALKEYTFLKPSDNEKLRRLQMPEGDQIIAAAVLKRALTVSAATGSVDPAQFAEVIGSQGVGGGALQNFSSQEMWRRVAGVHGSLEASNEKLAQVYDDWWRRWKIRPFTTIHQMATEYSRTNPIKYGGVMAMLGDLDVAFVWRNVVIAEVNGTVMAAGLCGYYREFKNTWPRDRERAYAVFFQKRFDFDPFDKKAGRFQYRALSARQAIDTPLGRVWATGCMVWALGANHEDDGAAAHSEDGSVGDLVVWPPVRALARTEGLLK